MDYSRLLRSRYVLHRAWRNVRTSGRASDSERTRLDTEAFEENVFSNLDRIERQLRRGQFEFVGEKGFALPKGKGKSGDRPLVVAPVANRVVRRAILDVLQGYGDSQSDPRRAWHGVPAIREVMATPTSVGGIRERGVSYAIALIEGAVRSGYHWFARSDIQNFFTRIPCDAVLQFVAAAVPDVAFVHLFDRALETNLTNEDELRERGKFILFPQNDIGVAQGSALSALAGNIALRGFDAEMNGRGILCIRYIDDFIILGTSRAGVVAAFKSAQRKLAALDMHVYELTDAARIAGKAHLGNVHDGTDILGYRLSGLSLQPSGAARKKLLEKLDAVVDACRRDLRSAVAAPPSKPKLRVAQALHQMNEITWGWCQSFGHTTARHVLEEIDRDIDKRVSAVLVEAKRLGSNEPVMRRRMLGVHMLNDATPRPLPDVSNILSQILTDSRVLRSA